MPRLITDADRSYILAQLANASDEVLVRAYQDWDAQRVAAVKVRTLIGQGGYEQPLDEQPLDEQPRVEALGDKVSRANVNPGPSTITKIGGTTKMEILAALQDGKQPNGKHLEHCKLLWERGEICFDGKGWYV